MTVRLNTSGNSFAPWWKIKRELKRVANKFIKFPTRIFTYFLGSWYFDKILSKKIIFTQGVLPSKKKVAVFVVYPKKGIQSSHILSIRYLINKDYDVLCVSNLVLNNDSRCLLSRYCIQVIERPNFGYDFGAYRQGILALRSQFSDLERLLLINDSTWFPVLGKDWLTLAESLPKCFVGAASVDHYAVPWPIDGIPVDISFHHNHRHRNFHYCSYALLINQPLIRDKRFMLFWERFPLTQSKDLTIRRGEIGLTKWVINHGFSHGETLDLPNLKKQLTSLSSEDLELIIRYMIIIPQNAKLKTLAESLLREIGLRGLKSSRNLLISLILIVASRVGISYSFPMFNVKFGNSMFFKKSPLWLTRESKETSLNFLHSLPKSDFEDIIVAEAEQHGRVS